MKASEFNTAVAAFASVVALGLAFVKIKEARESGSTSTAKEDTPKQTIAQAERNAGGPYNGGSFFDEETQAVFANPDTDLRAFDL